MKAKKLFLTCFAALLAVSVVALPVSAAEQPKMLQESFETDERILESREVNQYVDENGFTITEETLTYSYPSARATEHKVTGVKNYIVSRIGQGDLLTITLDADFYYIPNQSNSVYCPRYYSSYRVHRPELIKSYEETNMNYTTGSASATVKTQYKVVYVAYVNGGNTTIRPSMSITGSNSGKIT